MAVSGARGLFEAMREAAPWLKPILEEEENQGEFLAYPLMAEVNEALIARFMERAPENDSRAKEIGQFMEFMEEQYARSEGELKELIELGFLEGMAGPPEPYWRIRELMPPRLRRKIEEMWPADTPTEKPANGAPYR